jgi:flavin reductase (DIM6/NTAB) family NADH-FMN oxidoreductase RutF
MVAKKNFDPKEIPFHDTHRLLLSGVAPRPIAFVGSLDKDGKPNLAPFSYFNAFGSNPPVVCFSPAFSGKTGAPKDTFLNVIETKECTISIVTYDMVHQTSIASAPYERGVDEFEKSGFTKFPSQIVKAPGVAESPFIMEAKLLKHVDFGGLPGGANMMICEIVLFHIDEAVLGEKNSIDPHKMDQVARMGGTWYTRAAQGLFELAQPTAPVTGFDALPNEIRQSDFLSGHDIARLLAADIPEEAHRAQPSSETRRERHERAKELIENGDLEAAWKVLLS